MEINNPFDENSVTNYAFNEGYQAKEEAMIKWLFEKCDEHASQVRNGKLYFSNKHHQCFICMNNLKEGKI
ncbi:MAG: hypothetical protein WC516_08035 [Patescibacteria group bacterium]|jgi:hypothetical protein